VSASWCDGGFFMVWIRRHPGALVLLVALILGQVLQKLAAPLLIDTGGFNQVPVAPIVVLVIAIALAVVVIVLRVQLGATLRAAADVRLEVPKSLPSRYAVGAPGAQMVSALLALVDLVLLLLLQNTVRGSLLALVEHSQLLQRTTAEMVYVGVIVTIALVMLVRVFRVAGPVLVLLLWWGMDRIVPTVGFAGARPEVAHAGATTVTPVLRRPAAAVAALPHASDTPTVAAAAAQATGAGADPTLAAAGAGAEATLAAAGAGAEADGAVATAGVAAGADATVAAAAAHAPADEPTMLAEKTSVSLRRAQAAEDEQA
jgi:hypothetical protein